MEDADFSVFATKKESDWIPFLLVARGGFELILTLTKTLEILIERDLAYLTILRCNKSVTETAKIPSVRQIGI